MELRALWSVLVRWRWVVLIVTIGAILASGALAVISPPGYKATTILSFSAPPAATPATIPGLDEQNRLLSAEQVVDDFTKIVPSYGFAVGVSKRLSFPMDPRSIEKVWTIKKQAHHLLSIQASAPTEQQAVALAKAAADEVTQNGTQYYAALNTSDMKVAVPDPAHSEGVSGRLLDYLFIVARIVAGLIVGIGLAFLFNYLDDRIRDADQVELLGLHVIGVIPHANAPLLRRERETASIITPVGT
jgi:capsular polysaccharide biosynthesis protein